MGAKASQPQHASEPPADEDVDVDVEVGGEVLPLTTGNADVVPRVQLTPEELANLPLVLVMMGRVGSGKSSTANTIAGPSLGQPFESRQSAVSVTAACRTETVMVGDQRVLLLDVPGLGDASVSEDQVVSEMRRGYEELIPESAPVAMLLVMSLQSRVGEEDFAILSSLEGKVFGPDMLGSTLVVWTHADGLEASEGLAGFLEGAPLRLQEMLTRAGGGSVALNNKLPRSEAVPQQVQELLKQAKLVATPLKLVKERRDRIYGRKSARRRRQVEAGLLTRPLEVPGKNQSDNADGAGKSRCIVS